MRYFNHSWRTLSKRRCIIKLSLVAIITVTFFQSRHYYTIDISDDSFHQQSTCPACYGTDLCYAFTGQSNSKLQLQPSLWNRFLNTKNIYYGTLDNKRVVLKKLASDWELSLFNSFVCSLVLVNSNFTIQLSFQPSRCDVGKTLKHVVNIKLKRYHSPPDILWEITSLGKSFLEKRGISSDALQCNSRRFQSIIWSHFYSSGETSANVANLIMLFLINPEPIFLNVRKR